MSNPLQGFTVLPVAYSDTATHYIYARAHSGSKARNSTSGSSSSALPAGRTLFLVNIPPDATERELTLLFKYAGTVERVIFPDDDASEAVEEDGWESTDTVSDEERSGEEMDIDAENLPKMKKKKKNTRSNAPPPLVPLPTPSLRTLRRSGRSAHIIFLDESSLARALQQSGTSSQKQGSDRRPWPSSDEPRGLAHYLARYAAARPPLPAVRAHAEAAVSRWDWEQERARRASKYRKGEAIVDEDGFTLVVRGGAYGQTVGGGVGVASRKFQDEVAKDGPNTASAPGKRGRGRKKREGQDKEGFYAFQLHEKRRNNMIELKRKFAEDQERIKELQASKKFKPY